MLCCCEGANSHTASFLNPAQVIVMSATMDVDLFSEYFNKSPVLYLEGRQHPIQIYYTKQPQSDYLQAALVTIFQIHQVDFGICHLMERKVMHIFLHWVTDILVILICFVLFVSAVFTVWIKSKSKSLLASHETKIHEYSPPMSLHLCWFFFFFFCTGGPPIPWHLSLHDGPRGDRSSGKDVPGHCQAPAWWLRFNGSDPDVCVPSPGAAAQGLPARSKGKGSSKHAGKQSLGVSLFFSVLSLHFLAVSLFLSCCF